MLLVSRSHTWLTFRAVHTRAVTVDIDEYGDGWTGGFWTIYDCNHEVIAGGQDEGRVTGQGGETTFIVEECE